MLNRHWIHSCDDPIHALNRARQETGHPIQAKAPACHASRTLAGQPQVQPMQADPHIHNQQRDAHQQEAQRRLFPLRRLSNPRGRVVDRRSQRSHCWDHVTPLEETLSTLNDLVRDGKLRYLGASNYTGWQLQKAIDLSRRMGWEPFSCL